MRVFDLEQAIRQWRQELVKQQGLEPGFIEEIESNLRDRLEDYRAAGHNEEEAFKLAKEKSLSNAEQLADEYFKARTSRNRKPPWKQQKKNLPSLASLYNQNIMLEHYTRIFFKSFRRKIFTNLINILGLVVGMIAAIVIAKYIGYSLTFDNFHQNRQSIHQLSQIESKNGTIENTGNLTYRGIAIAAKQAIPEVINYTRFNSSVETLVTVSDEEGKATSYNENGIISVDSSFLQMFTYRLLYGSQEEALAAPYSAVITHRTARKYFGNKDPIGETITTQVSWGEKQNWTVTNVLEDPPNNSILQFDMLLSSPVDLDNLWEMPVDHQFIQTTSSDAASSNSQEVAQKISHYISDIPIFKDQGRKVSVILSPLTPSLTTFELMLVLVGLGILMLSWINFINLSIAQSLNRFGEVMIRKALGSSHRQLIAQFVFESLLINGTALLLTILFLLLSYSHFEELTGNHLLPLFDNSLQINTLFLVSFVIGSLLTSAYPSLFLVSKKVHGLSSLGKVGDRRGQGLRKGLVIAQFAISSVMIVSSYVIASQMDYMMSQDTGFDATNKLIIKPPKDQGKGKLERMFAIKQELAKLSWVERVTTSTTVPGESYRHEVYFSLKGSDQRPLLYVDGVDTSFAKTYGIKLLAGTNFLTAGGPHINTDKVMINEAATRALGLSAENAIHQEIVDQEEGETYTIVGVVRDFHKLSLKDPIEPTLFQYNPRRGYITLNVGSKAMNSLSGKVSELKTVWQRVYQDQPFEYFFLADMYYSQYNAENFFRTVFRVFTFISIFLACLGLIGLAMFEVTNGRLEVGIRKTFGASSLDVLVFFFKKYAFLLLIATIIGVPISYYIMDSWLEEYNFRIALGVQHLLVPLLLLLIIAFATISIQLIRLSLVNPAKILREA